MGITPDRFDGPSEEEEIKLEDRTADGNPTVNGAIRYVSGDIVAKLPSGVASLTTGSGLSTGQHEALDQLVHDIAEDSYEEVTYTGSRVDSIIVWTTAGKTQKIREELFTYTGTKVTLVVTKQYDGSGTLVKTMTETLSYTGNKLDDITRVMS